MCEYCNPNMSHGNTSIVKNNDTDVYIVKGILYVLLENDNFAIKTKINYCPICGKKLEAHNG